MTKFGFGLWLVIVGFSWIAISAGTNGWLTDAKPYSCMYLEMLIYPAMIMMGAILILESKTK